MRCSLIYFLYYLTINSADEKEDASQACSDAESEYKEPGPSRQCKIKKKRGTKRKRADSILEAEATPGAKQKGSINCGAYPKTGARTTDTLGVVIPVDEQKRHLQCVFRYDNGSICRESFSFETDPTDAEKKAVENHVKKHILRKTGDLPCWQCGAKGKYHPLGAATLKKHILQTHFKTTHWRCPFCGEKYCQGEHSFTVRHLKTCEAARAAGTKTKKGKSTKGKSRRK